MSVGSPAGLARGATLTKTLEAQVPVPAPVQFRDKGDDSSDSEEEMDATTEGIQDAQQE